MKKSLVALLALVAVVTSGCLKGDFQNGTFFFPAVSLEEGANADYDGLVIKWNGSEMDWEEQRNSDGDIAFVRWTLESPGPGSYDYMVTCPGYETYFRSYDLSIGDTVRLDGLNVQLRNSAFAHPAITLERGTEDDYTRLRVTWNSKDQNLSYVNDGDYTEGVTWSIDPSKINTSPDFDYVYRVSCPGYETAIDTVKFTEDQLGKDYITSKLTKHLVKASEE